MAYLPLSTANLPNPVIDPAQDATPEDHMNVVTYTGTGSAQSITGVGHQPDWVWTKRRNAIGDHKIFDSVRGVYNFLESNTTDAEGSSTETLTSFDSDGFSVGTGTTVNNSGTTYVAWNWKANGSGVSNTDGSITSTVSANTTSGFSIITYTGNGASGQSIGHGLNSKPELVFKKNRSTAANWAVTTTIIDGSNDYAFLNATNAFGNSAEGAPTSSVIPVYPNTENNSSGDNFICYAFHSVEGFSKIGKYVGNGSTDGTFVYTGFRPAMVIMKASSGVSNWTILDDARDTFNVTTKRLQPNLANAEDTPVPVDFLSNGFKHRSTNLNGSGDTHIYMAFAKNPFKYSNAR